MYKTNIYLANSFKILLDYPVWNVQSKHKAVIESCDLREIKSTLEGWLNKDMKNQDFVVLNKWIEICKRKGLGNIMKYMYKKEFHKLIFQVLLIEYTSSANMCTYGMFNRRMPAVFI